MPGMSPEFPMDLGDTYLQTDGSADYGAGRNIFATEIGKDSTRDTPKAPYINPSSDGFGFYNS